MSVGLLACWGARDAAFGVFALALDAFTVRMKSWHDDREILYSHLLFLQICNYCSAERLCSVYFLPKLFYFGSSSSSLLFSSLLFSSLVISWIDEYQSERASAESWGCI